MDIIAVSIAPVLFLHNKPMCGIAAFAGIKNITPQQARVAVNKMKILGLYNQSRGTHGCGLYINGVIHKGVDDTVNKKNTKEFKDFLANEDFIWPELDAPKQNTMILHTRQATWGAHVEANTHPFRIKPLEGDNDLVGVHNGTIENVWTTLCKKYEVDHAAEHIHVDSKALYTIIERHGLDVLNEYKGYAALVWTRRNEPNTLYVYHGASRKDRTSEELWEERPLYYLRTAEGVYFSSMMSSLNAVRESAKQEVELLEYNTVFKITNGKFTATKVVVDRKDANLTPVYTTTNVRRGGDETLPAVPFPQQGCRVSPQISGKNTGNTMGFDQHRNLRTIAEESSRNAALREAREARAEEASKDLKTPSESLVWRETCPPPSLATYNKECVRFYQGRYRRAGNKLCNGLLYIKDRGIIVDDTETDAKPYWFWQGVLLRNEECYESVTVESKVKNSWVSQLTSNWAYCISRFSSHPVTNLDSEAVDANNFFRFAWYHDERIVQIAQFRPEWSGRCYTIANGFCIKVIPSNSDDKLVLTPKKGEQGVALDLCCGYNETVAESEEVNENPLDTPKPIKSTFDVIFKDIEQFFTVADPLQIQAMEEFVRDNLKQMWNQFPTENEVQNELWMSIRTAIAADKTVREGLNDVDCLLEKYVKMVEKEPSLVNEARAKRPSMDDHIRFYDKYGYWPDSGIGPEKGSFHSALQKPVLDDLPWERGNSYPEDEAANEAALQDYLEATGAIVIGDIHQALEHHEQKIFKEEEALKEANKLMDTAIATVQELNNVADELQAMDESDYAQDAANVIYKVVGACKHELGEVCSIHHQPDAIMRLNQIVQ